MFLAWPIVCAFSFASRLYATANIVILCGSDKYLFVLIVKKIKNSSPCGDFLTKKK